MQFAFHLVMEGEEGTEKPIFIELWAFQASCYVFSVGHRILSLIIRAVSQEHWWELSGVKVGRQGLELVLRGWFVFRFAGGIVISCQDKGPSADLYSTSWVLEYFTTFNSTHLLNLRHVIQLCGPRLKSGSDYFQNWSIIFLHVGGVIFRVAL